MQAERRSAKGWLAEWGPVIVAWSLVSLPLAWGVLMSLKKAAQLLAPGR